VCSHSLCFLSKRITAPAVYNLSILKNDAQGMYTAIDDINLPVEQASKEMLKKPMSL